MRLIDADALEKYVNCTDEAIEAAAEEIISNEVMRGIAIKIAKDLRETVTTDINEQPTIDAEPVVHAHWIETEEKYEDERCRYSYWMCSNCNTWLSGRYGLYRYCPNCGAIMDEESEE